VCISNITKVRPFHAFGRIGENKRLQGDSLVLSRTQLYMFSTPKTAHSRPLDDSPGGTRVTLSSRAHHRVPR
jgi:hypothetical protein